LDKANAEKCDYAAYAKIHIYATYFCICDFENAIICGKTCAMRVLAKYLHITSILKKRTLELSAINFFL